jgi:hypothetical protein
MDRRGQSFVNRCCILFFAVALVGGCNSSSSGAGGERGSAAAALDAERTRVDVMCLGDLIDKPADAFHYSYKYTDATMAVEKHADITPQSMDVTIADKSGSHKYHAVRSDEASWNGAVLGLSSLSITAMAARLDSLNGTSAIISHGTEPINGYTAAKYSIDTTRANSTDQQRFETFFGKGSFNKGTAWMGQDGCAIKLVLDEGVLQTNQTVETRHYEMARVKK